MDIQRQDVCAAAQLFGQLATHYFRANLAEIYICAYVSTFLQTNFRLCTV